MIVVERQNDLLRNKGVCAIYDMLYMTGRK